jgi:hypothetical protein
MRKVEPKLDNPRLYYIQIKLKIFYGILGKYLKR